MFWAYGPLILGKILSCENRNSSRDEDEKAKKKMCHVNTEYAKHVGRQDMCAQPTENAPAEPKLLSSLKVRHRFNVNMLKYFA